MSKIKQLTALDRYGTSEKSRCPMCYKKMCPTTWLRHAKRVHNLDKEEVLSDKNFATQNFVYYFASNMSARERRKRNIEKYMEREQRYRKKNREMVNENSKRSYHRAKQKRKFRG